MPACASVVLDCPTAPPNWAQAGGCQSVRCRSDRRMGFRRCATGDLICARYGSSSHRLARSGTRRSDRQWMSALAFGCEVPEFPMQRQALLRLAGTVEVRAEGVVPLHESSVVQASDVHVRNAMPTPVRSRGWAPAPLVVLQSLNYHGSRTIGRPMSDPWPEIRNRDQQAAPPSGRAAAQRSFRSA